MPDYDDCRHQQLRVVTPLLMRRRRRCLCRRRYEDATPCKMMLKRLLAAALMPLLMPAAAMLMLRCLFSYITAPLRCRCAMSALRDACRAAYAPRATAPRHAALMMPPRRLMLRHTTDIR